MKMHSTPNVHLGNNSSEITKQNENIQFFFFLMKPPIFFLDSDSAF
jgi:hypothetical protein